MLVLTRKLNERIIIDEQIEIIVLDIKDGQIKLGIKAPRDVSIHREEVYDEIRSENRKAQTNNRKNLSSAADVLKNNLKKKP